MIRGRPIGQRSTLTQTRHQPAVRDVACAVLTGNQRRTAVVFELILIGLVITLEPIPLTAFILILASRGGVRKGAAFIFGWLLSLAIVVAATVLITGNKPPKPSTAPSLAALAVKIAIGVALVIIAIRQWRRMGKPKK